MSTKLTIQTPKGEIAIYPSSDPSYPGFFIDINGVQVANVEYHSFDDEHVVRVWDGEQEDHVFRQTYKLKPWDHEPNSVKIVVQDVIGTMESMMDSEKIPELSDSQIYEVARRVHDGYDHSPYDEYIGDVIRGVLSGEF